MRAFSLLPSRIYSHLSGSSLLTDPKSRKVIIIEHPLLPVYVKEIVARVLFENLQVMPSTMLPPSILTPC